MTRYLFIDTETTGLNPFNNDVIEIGAVIYEDDADMNPVEVARFIGAMPSGTGQEINIEALQVNGRNLIDDTVQENNELRKQILMGFAQWLIKYVNKDTLIIGHNISFDLEFIKQAGVRANLDFDKILSSRKAIDTRQLAMFLHDAGVIDVKNFRLVTIHNELFGLNREENAHLAIADTLHTADVYFKMRDMI